MRIYISMAGRNPRLALNGLWAVLKEGIFDPEIVVILSPDVNVAEELEKSMQRLLGSYGFDTDIMKIETHLNAYEVTEKDDEVSLDITGGDKASVARLLLHGDASHYKHIFYLHTEEKAHASTPYPLMDRRKTKLQDLINEEVK